MAKKHLNKIFLSASIPYPERDKRFYDTADIIAIRDAVRALATVVIPKAHLIWGGHPSITPLIRFVMDRMNAELNQHITLYQSQFFENQLPRDNSAFENIVLTPKTSDLKESLSIMRKSLFEDNNFSVGIFIGGMEGILNEFDMFIKTHPKAIVLPIASTGAAAKILFDRSEQKYNRRLLNDYAYMALFRELLVEYL